MTEEELREDGFEEIWKDIPTWEGIYQCSNYGRIKRLKYGKVKYERIYQGSKDVSTGYYMFFLCTKNRKERWQLHRLVATVFQRPLVKDEEAHHKNKMKCCNCIFNIQIKMKIKHVREHKLGNKNMLGKHHSPESIAKRTATRMKNDPNYGRKKNDD